MVMQFVSRALMGLALLNGVAQGINIYVSNMCDESMTLAHVSPSGSETEQVAAGGTTTKSIAPGSASHVFKWGTGAQATLAEFSCEGGMVWYDISIIPTGTKSGPGYCESLQACKDQTGGVGFNVAMQITPHSPDGARCVELTCMADGCADGYQFPKDDTKTHTCPLSTDFDLTFCPGGTGGATPAPQTQPPTQAPATQAPTPTPTPSPTPTPTPTSNPSGEQNSAPASGSHGSAGHYQNQNHYEHQSSKSASASASQAETGVKQSNNNMRQVDSESTTKTVSQTAQSTEKTIGNTPSTASKEDGVQTVTNRTAEDGGNSTPYVVLTIGAAVGMVAAAAIFVVRKKKAMLDELESKTPRSTTAQGPLAHFRTPRDNKLAIKFGNLALETFLLVQMLESGSPTPLVAFFAFVVVFNAIACAGMMFVPYERAPLGELYIDVSIDFLVAIGCPMLVVVYCLSAFTFDRTKFAINMEVYPSGWFEQDASVNADPVQVAVIYKSLKSLRIMTALECLARVGVNVMFSFRLRYVVEIIRSPKRLRSSAYPKRHRLGAIGLVLYAIILVIFVEESMRTSTMACHPHPEYAVNAHRWTILKSNSLTQCPCLMLIDQDIAPKTFAEWIMPMNVTEKVAQLATTGDLEMLQLTNRYLGELPVELRHCKNLRHLSLEYTNTQTFPPWVKEFTKLEFLHVESKVSSPLVLLPDDMFDDMPSLTFIHLAMCISMPKLPSLQGVSGLKSLTLADSLALQEIPPLTNLHKLERFCLRGSCIDR
ncbi:uncharacterized protein IUM83_09197 [Phytophthora cinnamomi]|uniref:uncharacterized protein n=1 Tax=Phytophthora cinnamomi TaxID=4785 RepID=UPI00355ABAF2|nr:hypothetical protein IUM83_09197 [Phytophthora cinnamomi]